MDRIVANFVLCLALVSGVEVAQTTVDQPTGFADAEISGVVRDHDGIELREAIVSVALVGASGTATTTNTGKRGLFTFHRVLAEPQKYELTIRCQGFQTFSRIVDLAPGGRAEVYAEMELLPFFENPNLPETISEKLRPLRTTLCDIMKAPGEFSGKFIQFRANIFARPRRRDFNLSSGGCSTDVRFAISRDASVEARLKNQFYFVESRQIEATVAAGLLWTPSAQDDFQMMLVSIGDVVHGQKTNTVWVSGKLIDPARKPIAHIKLYLGPPNPPMRTDNVGFPQYFSDKDGQFLIPFSIGRQRTALFEVTGCIGAYGRTCYPFHKKISMSVGRNVDLGTVVIKPDRR